MTLRLKYSSDGQAEVVDSDEEHLLDDPRDVDWRGVDDLRPLTISQRRAAMAALERKINGPKERAFEEFLRTDEAAEARAQAEGTASSGGYIVPDVFANTFLENLQAADPLFSAARMIETATGGDTKIPLDDDTAVATEISESGTSATNTPVVFDAISFTKTPMWRSGLVRCPRELVTDSGFDLSGLLAGVFSRRFARGCGSAFVTQLLNDADVGVTTDAATVIAADDVVSLFASLDSGYAMQGSWLMNFGVYAAILKLTSTGGNFMFPAEVDGRGFPLLLGRRIYLSPSMPDATAELKPIAFGDLSRFVVRRVRNSLTVNVFPERYAEYLQVAFEGHLRIQAALAKTATAPPAIRLLQMHN